MTSLAEMRDIMTVLQKVFLQKVSTAKGIAIKGIATKGIGYKRFRQQKVSATKGSDFHFSPFSAPLPA